MMNDVAQLDGDMANERHVDHQIADVTCFGVRLPMMKALKTSTHTIAFGPSLYVRVRTRGGVEGWGESGADLVMGGETVIGMAEVINQHIKPCMLGNSIFDRVTILDRLRSIYGNGGAKTAIDIALLDALGKTLNVRAVDILGGLRRQSVKILRLIGGSGNIKDDVSEALNLQSLGFQAFKLKVGVTSMETEAAIVNRLRKELGADPRIAVDANMAWDVSTARRFASLTRDCDVQFIEQPVPVGDIGSLAAVSISTNTPIGADESIHSPGDIVALSRRNAVRGVSLKTAKLGGASAVVSAAILADSLGLAVNLAMLVESSVASAALIHIACAVPQVSWGLSVGRLLLADDPCSGLPQFSNGEISCPRGPGIGISVDEQDLRRYGSPL